MKSWNSFFAEQSRETLIRAIEAFRQKFEDVKMIAKIDITLGGSRSKILMLQTPELSS